VRHRPPERRFCRRFFRGAFGIGCCFGVGNTLQMMADLFRNFDSD